MELLDAPAGKATVRMTVGKTMINGHGIAHGGYVFLLADTAFACACNSRGVATVAAGADITFVAPVREGAVLVAEAAERVSFGRSGIYDVTVRSGDQVVAEFRGRSRAAGRLEDAS
jgi:acyl-CoA thioesterase